MHNIEYYQLLILIAQCIVVAAFLLLFFRLRTIFGLGLFYIAIGLFKFMHYFFTQAFSVEIAPGIQILIGPTVITSAILFSLLLIYIREDAGEVRKIIYALIFFNFFFAVILRISALGMNGAGFVNKLNLPEHFFRMDIGSLIAGSLVLFIDGIVLIVLYEFISKKISSLFFRIFLTMTTVLFLNSLIFNSVSLIFRSEDVSLLKGYAISTLISKAISISVYTVTFWLYIVFFERRVDNSKQTASSFRDVFNLLTYRQKYALTQDKLIESQDKYKKLTENTSFGIGVSKGTELIFANKKLLEMFMVDSIDRFNEKEPLYYLTPESKEKTKERMKKLSQGDNLSENFEIDIVRTDGEQRTLELRFTNITIDGESCRLSTYNDITERKQADKKLKAANQQLEANNQQLHATEQQLIASNQELKKAVEELNIEQSKVSFLYNLSLSINKSVSIDDAIEQTLEQINSIVKPYNSFFFLKNNEELNLKQVCPYNTIKAFDGVETHKVGECICGLSVSQNKALYSKNIHEDLRCTWDEFKKAGLRSFAALPLRHEDSVIGLIGISSMEERDFEKESEFLETISEQISTALSKAKLLQTLKDNEARLKEAELIAKMGNFTWDIKSGDVTWSDGLHALLGYDKSQKIDYNKVNVEIHHPDDLERITAWLNECIASGKSNFPPKEYRLLRKDGKVLHVQTTIKVQSEDNVPYKIMGTVQDITQRKEAEEALKLAHARFLDVLEKMSDAFVSIDRNWCYTYMNEKAGDIFNRDPKEMIGKHIWTEFPEGIGQPFHLNYEKAMNEKVFIQMEEYYPPYNKWFENRINPIDEGIAIFFTDITDRKQAEEALNRSKNRYQSLFNNSPTPLWEEDFSEVKKFIDLLKQDNVKDFKAYFKNHPDKVLTCTQMVKITDVNNAVLKLHEAKSKEDLLEGLPSIFTDKSYEAFTQELIAIAEGNNIYEFEGNVKTLKGKEKEVYIKWIIVPGYEDTLEKVYLSTTDITDSKQAQEKLKESEEKFRNIFQQSPLAIQLYDPEGNLLDINPKTLELFGLNDKKYVSGFNFWNDPNLSDEDAKALKKAKPVYISTTYNFETFGDSIQFPTSRKGLIYIDMYVMPMKSQNKIIGYLVHIVEVTDQKLAEKELKKHRDHLEELVKARTKELQLSNKELEAFSYSVSHDLRAPLRAIDGFTRILMEDYVEKLDEEGKRVGSVIQKNAQKMGKLIDDLLAFSRLGRTSMQFSGIDMKNMANAIYHEATNSSERKRIKFTVTDLPDAYGDTNMMRQVWMNLISNAIKFSSKRGKAIISITGTQDDEKTTYRISDNGVGFEMQYVNKIFDVFQRLHTDKEFPGTGVGLSLVQRIINRHNGATWAESELDKGATFYFSLPKKIINETNKL